jgi:hypothetical protein
MLQVSVKVLVSSNSLNHGFTEKVQVKDKPLTTQNKKPLTGLIS